jgi:hypothetical protein
MYDKDDANKIIAFIKVIVVTIFFKRKVIKKIAINIFKIIN